MGCSGSSAGPDDPSEYNCEQSPERSGLKKLIASRKWEVGDLELETVVGEGMFSCVRVAKIKEPRDETTPIALKVLKKRDMVKMQQVEHVRQEKDILLRISHPFIVDLLGTFQDEQSLYMMMEFVNGGELHEYIQLQAGQTPKSDCVFFCSEIFMAIAYLHALDIVHRDLKPQNLLLDDQGHVKLTDFGFAKIIPSKEKSFTMVGTPEYVAPEIIAKEGHGKAVDWWAFGIVLFEILLGYTPFCGETMDDIFANVVEGKIDCPKHMDASAKDLVTKLLVPNPTKRLGCLKTGAKGLQKHKFFAGIDFRSMLNRRQPAPHKPTVSSADDTSMFAKYSNRVSVGAETVTEEEQKMFRRFSTHGEQVIPPVSELKNRMYPQPKASLATNAPELAEVTF